MGALGATFAAAWKSISCCSGVQSDATPYHHVKTLLKRTHSLKYEGAYDDIWLDLLNIRDEFIHAYIGQRLEPCSGSVCF